MKVTTKEVKQGFEPVEVTILIETKAELQGLLNRIQLGAAQVNELTNVRDHTTKEFNPLHQILITLNERAK